MKKQFLKNTWVSVTAIIALTALFVITQSVVAQTSVVDIINTSDASINKFQLSPTSISNVPSNPNVYKSSLDQQNYFRVHGDSILADTIINEDAVFAENEDSLLTTQQKVLNVGYSSLSGAGSPPSLAALQVNGTIKVSYLANSLQTGDYCLCANGYGELARCGVYDPSQGLTCS